MYERATPARTQLASHGDQRMGADHHMTTQTKGRKKETNNMHECATPAGTQLLHMGSVQDNETSVPKHGQ